MSRRLPPGLTRVVTKINDGYALAVTLHPDPRPTICIRLLRASDGAKTPFRVTFAARYLPRLIATLAMVQDEILGAAVPNEPPNPGEEA